MPYTFGVKGIAGAKQIVPGLPSGSCTNYIDNSITNVLNNYCSAFKPLNTCFDTTFADWSKFTATAASVTTAVEVSNSKSRSLYNYTYLNSNGFPISDTEFLTITAEQANFKLYATVINFASETSPLITGDYLLCTNSSSHTAATIYPAETPRVFLSITTPSVTTDTMECGVYKVDSQGYISKISMGTVTGTITNYGYVSGNGVIIKPTPLGLFSGNEYWLCSGGNSGSNTLIQFEHATGNMTYTQLPLYLSGFVAFNKTSNSIMVSGHAHPQLLAGVISGSPYASMCPKVGAVLNFNQNTGVYVNYTDNFASMNDSISIKGYYPYYHGQSQTFGNNPEIILSLAGSNGQDDSSNTPPTNYSNYRFLSMINATPGEHIKSRYIDWNPSFSAHYINNLPNKAFACFNSALDYQASSMHVGYYDNTKGKYFLKTISSPSGFDNSTTGNNKLVVLKDRIVWLNKLRADTTKNIMLSFVYPK